jgi:diguanylate cyclase (GGDEF)-like protein
LEELRALWRSQSTIDQATGLPNARALAQRLALEFNRSRRYRSTFSLLRIEIDDFATFTAEFGGGAGQKLVTTVAGALDACIRNTDLLAIHDGGGFIVLLAETHALGAVMFAERMCHQTSALSTETWQTSISIGISSMRQGVDDGFVLMDEAALALHATRTSGKGRIVHRTELNEDRRA